LLQDESLSPQEIKIKVLEKNISETTEKREELQQLWLQQQTHTVQLTKQRNEQLQNMNLMHKRKRKQHTSLCAPSLSLDFIIPFNLHL
jgi:hypothetical protein